MNSFRHQTTQRLVLLSMFIAIIIVQSLVPFLGYMTIGVVSITLIQLTVAISAILLGNRAGLMTGFVWGLLSFIRSWTSPSSPLEVLMFHNPFIAILPRVLVGLLAGIAYNMVSKRKNDILAASVSGLVASVTNTVLVLGLSAFFFIGLHTTMGTVSGTQWIWILLGIAGNNGIFEGIFSFVVTPIIVTPLLKSSHLKHLLQGD